MFAPDLRSLLFVADVGPTFAQLDGSGNAPGIKRRSIGKRLKNKVARQVHQPLFGLE